MIITTSGDLQVRRLTLEDAEIMSKWLRDERVLEFYGGRDRPLSVEMVKETFLKKTGDPVMGCIIVYQRREIGFIQYYPIDEREREQFGYEPADAVYGMDQFIGEPGYWNQGIGSQLVKMMTEYLFQSFSANCVILDPQVRNTRAVRCYEKCGFRRVRVLARQELHEGTWEDCWLMELRGQQMEGTVRPTQNSPSLE